MVKIPTFFYFFKGLCPLSSPQAYPWWKEHLFQRHICCAGTIRSGWFWWGNYEHQQQTKNSFLLRRSFMKYTKEYFRQKCIFFSHGKAFLWEGISFRNESQISGRFILFNGILSFFNKFASKIIMRWSRYIREDKRSFKQILPKCTLHAKWQCVLFSYVKNNILALITEQSTDRDEKIMKIED